MKLSGLCRAMAVGGLGIGLAGCGGGRVPERAAPVAGTAAADDLAALRMATRAYQDLRAAVAAGYVAEVAACIVHEHHGAMGYHHINRGYITRDLAVERPQFLLYERVPGGEYRLNAVEFILPFRLWPRDSVPPTIMGQAMKPEYNFEYWYLHVWAWRDNPDGVFSDWHPEVRCSDESRRVYRPNP